MTWIFLLSHFIAQDQFFHTWNFVREPFNKRNSLYMRFQLIGRPALSRWGRSLRRRTTRSTRGRRGVPTMEMVLTKMRCEMFFNNVDGGGDGGVGGGSKSFWAKQSWNLSFKRIKLQKKIYFQFPCRFQHASRSFGRPTSWSTPSRCGLLIIVRLPENSDEYTGWFF